MGFSGLMGEGGMDLDKEVKGRYRIGMERGTGLINDAFGVSHHGFFRGSESNL